MYEALRYAACLTLLLAGCGEESVTCETYSEGNVAYQECRSPNGQVTCYRAGATEVKYNACGDD